MFFCASVAPTSNLRGRRFTGNRARPQLRVGGYQRLPHTRLGRKLPRSAVNVLLEDRSEVRWIAEATAIGHLRHVESWIQPQSFGQFHSLANQKFLERHPRCPAIHAAEMP